MAGVVRCPTLVGRQPALELVDALLDGVRLHAGGCLVVVGEPGVGKSRVVVEASLRAANRSLTVLTGRGSVVAGGASLRPVAEAVARYARSTPEPPEYLGAYLPILGRFAPAWDMRIGPEGSPVLVGEALLRLADGQPDGALLILEDLHWADPDTLHVLEYLADGAATSRLAILATTRPPTGDLASLIQGLEGRSAAAVDNLPRLGTADAEAVASACLGVQGSLAPSVAELVAAAEGLPLLIEDLLADSVAREALRCDLDGWKVTDASLRAPPSFAVSVVSRVGALDATTRRVLHAAAVLGRDFDEQLLATTLDLPPDAVAGALLDAEGAHIVERASRTGGTDRSYRFRHALTRDAVLGEIPGQERASLASAAADASITAGAAADVVASLLALAGRSDQAAGLLVEAAATEERIGTHTAALSLLARAQTMAKDPDLAQRVTLAQVRLLADAGLAHDALARAREVLPYLPADEARAVRLRLAGAAIRSQDPSTARAQLDTVKALGGLPDVEWAEVWSLEAGLTLIGTGPERVTEAEHLAHRAVAAAARAGLPSVQCQSLLVLGRCARLRDLAAAEDAFRAAFRAADDASLAVERVNALAELGTVQMMREVRADTLKQARDAAEVIGAPVTAAGISVNLAGVRIMRGELDEAVAEARSAQDAARRLGLTGALAATTMFEGIALGHAGHPHEMDRLLREAEQVGAGDPDVLVGSWAIGRAIVALLDEDRPRAVRALARANDVIRQRPVLMVDPAAGPTVLLAALDRSSGWDDVDAAERRSGAGSAWTRMWIESARAVLTGATGDRSPDAFAADGLDAGSRYPVFGLVAARIVAEAQLRDGWGDPLPLLTDLESRARDRGYRRLAVACRTLQRSAGVRVPRRRAVDLDLAEGLQALGVTAREAEVLDLLRERLTTPEIATRLYLSPRTVEKHVASLMTKTGARGRAELADVARDPTSAPLLGGHDRREGG